MGTDWLAERRVEVAADRILDAAEDLFTRRDAATVNMNEIARAAGCSRATLYRYFENRDALYTAYVHREAYRVFGGLGERLDTTAPPAVRLVDAIVESLRLVRGSPALSSWFAPTQRPIGGEMAERSEVIHGLTAAYLRTLGIGDGERLARWLVRVMISMLVFPGHDADDERAMLDEFVAPLVANTVAAGFTPEPQ